MSAAEFVRTGPPSPVPALVEGRLEQHLDDNPAVHVRRPEVDPDASNTPG